MIVCSLSLTPYGKQSFSVELSDASENRSSVKEIINGSNAAKCIFSDLTYTWTIRSDQLEMIRDVRVYINDTFEPSVYANGTIRFPSHTNIDRRIFIDCYGFVSIGLTLLLNDNNEIHFMTDYLPVLVRRGELNESIKSMVSYVYTHQDSLLLNGEPRPKDLASLKEKGYQNIASQIILAEEIAAIYESSYGYFRNNSRFQIEQVSTVDRTEKLQWLTPATLQYIATHPEQLKQVSGTTGLQLGKHFYQPLKTLIQQGKCSYDIYENHVVLDFLQEMYDTICSLKGKCDLLVSQIPSNEDYSTEYIYSSFFMFLETRNMLIRSSQKLSELSTKFSHLLFMYSDAFKLKPKPIHDRPQATAIFMSVPQYNKIFTKIYQWYNFGIYDFQRETYMLSFIKISYLYESYLLAKLICYFKDRDFLLEKSYRCAYPTSPKWKYRNTKCKNTFVFKQDAKIITLYYQPVIFDTDQSFVNGIGLYRNNSIPLQTGENDDGHPGAHYYCPDYLLKCENKGTTKYIIADAKFSEHDTVFRRYVKDLAFKYLFSISPIDPSDKIIGLCILYGKCAKSDQLDTAYDNQLSTHKIVPFTELLPMMECLPNKTQYSQLDQVFNQF